MTSRASLAVFPNDVSAQRSSYNVHVVIGDITVTFVCRIR